MSYPAEEEGDIVSPRCAVLLFAFGHQPISLWFCSLGQTSLPIYKVDIRNALLRRCETLAATPCCCCKFRDLGITLGLNNCILLQNKFGVALATQVL